MLGQGTKVLGLKVSKSQNSTRGFSPDWHHYLQLWSVPSLFVIPPNLG